MCLHPEELPVAKEGGITWLSSSFKLFLGRWEGKGAQSHFILIFGDVCLICTPKLEVKQNLLSTNLFNWLMWSSLKKKKKAIS